ncbi:hypothetical protein [Paraburkholderia susongensis]|uniref:Uncharacterized protein n=1 Tax=Paraburkholderia susongensis TaxID=1515439 RepID=A0A1X7IZ45_9BURK|nr:hypothetical protein [Paraburkholderia susongensis]SMG20611.1 hypothetical protein SAMN06265784_1028 [Paraburkholderia susongensis]
MRQTEAGRYSKPQRGEAPTTRAYDRAVHLHHLSHHLNHHVKGALK